MHREEKTRSLMSIARRASARGHGTGGQRFARRACCACAPILMTTMAALLGALP